jgi:hypothetical protein
MFLAESGRCRCESRRCLGDEGSWGDDEPTLLTESGRCRCESGRCLCYEGSREGDEPISLGDKQTSVGHKAIAWR